MKLVIDAQRVGDWVAKRLNIAGFVPPYTALGWQRDGEFIGGVVFNNYAGANIDATVAWTGPLTRSVLKHIRAYVFVQNKCRRMTIQTRARNTKIIDQAKRMGFSLEGFHPDYFPDDDGVTLGILRHDCKW